MEEVYSGVPTPCSNRPEEFRAGVAGGEGQGGGTGRAGTLAELKFHMPEPAAQSWPLPSAPELHSSALGQEGHTLLSAAGVDSPVLPVLPPALPAGRDTGV